MSRLRFAVLFAASPFGVLLAASASSSPPPEVYSVGDETRPPGNGDGTAQTLSNCWAMRQSFYVGDVLDFERSNDSVLLVRQADYEHCTAASPFRRFFADGGGDDGTRFTLAHPGLFYFINGVPARCEAGQRMVVRVADPLDTSGAAPTPAPAPAPGTEAAATASTRRRRPLTIVETQMVAGALGFAAGFVTIFLIIGLSICFCP